MRLLRRGDTPAHRYNGAMRPKPPPDYLAGYPPALVAQVNALIAQDRLGAVLPDAHGDALLVEDHARIRGVNVVEHEADHAGLVLARSDDAQAVDGAELLRGVFEHLVLVGLHRIEPDLHQVLEPDA